MRRNEPLTLRMMSFLSGTRNCFSFSVSTLRSSRSSNSVPSPNFLPIPLGRVCIVNVRGEALVELEEDGVGRWMKSD